MGDIAIKAEGLGKRYRLRSGTKRPDTLRDALAAGTRNIGERLGRLARGHLSANGRTEDFWALRDVDFEIRRGEAVGVIGRNGAGKSTLLKILSRITEPTTGRVTLEGRVASLLEVGTGFHPELTGRENIFLNGALIGMRRAEIRNKFDEIVDFAGVERFLDTPVKRYSSGMYVRLAFAVAAHLEPEILIVDEVLAVGDAEFQKKCLGKMEDVAGEGRTILFVSHNIAAVRNLCTSGILLGEGAVVARGEAAEVLTLYAGGFGEDCGFMSGEFVADRSPGGGGQGAFRLERVRVSGVRSGRLGRADTGEAIAIELCYDQTVPLTLSRIVLFIRNGEKDVLLATTDEAARARAGGGDTRGESFVSQAIIPAGLLLPGDYSVEVRAAIPGMDVLYPNPEVCGFRVDGPIRNGARTPPERWHGMVCPAVDWHVEQELVR